MEVEGVTIINVYKPPSVKMDTTGLPYFSHPCMYAGDFNCHSTTWGYRSTNASGEALEDWASASSLNLLHDPKQPDSFHSRRWNTGTNPDLAFVHLGGPLPHRTILKPFTNSQHRPSLIQPINPIKPLTPKPVLRWNFRKARWKQFINLPESEADFLPDPYSNPDAAYSAFCHLLHLLQPGRSVLCLLPPASLYRPDVYPSWMPSTVHPHLGQWMRPALQCNPAF